MSLEKIRDVINELILQFENTNRGLTIVETPTGFILQIKNKGKNFGKIPY